MNKLLTKHPFLISMMYSICVLLLFVFFIGIHYEGKDDWMIAKMICCWGDCYTTFSDVNLLKLLIKINTIFPKVNTWIVFQLMMNCLSFAYLTYIAVLNRSKKTGALLCLSFTFLFSYDLFFSIQYTKTSAFSIIVGAFLITDYLVCHRKKKIIFGGVILFIIGSMIRFDNYKLGIIFLAIGIILFCCYNERVYFKNINRKQVVSGFCIFIMVLCIPIALKYITIQENHSNDTLIENEDFIVSNSYLIDHCRIPEYESNKIEYDKMGFSENDVQCYSNWIFDLDGNINLDDIKEMTDFSNKTILDELKNPYNSGIMKVKTAIKGLFQAIKIKQISMAIYPIQIVSFILIIVLFILHRNKKALVLEALLIFLSFALYVYLFFDFRVITRVTFGIFSGFILFSFEIFQIFGNKTNVSKKRTPFIHLIEFILIFSFTCYAFFTTSDKIKKIEPYKDLKVEEYINKNPDKIYIIDNKDLYDFYNRQYSKQNPLRGDNWTTNAIDLGFWTSRTISSRNNLKALGINNIYSDMINNPNVNLVLDKGNDNCSLLLNYLNEHYVDNGLKVILKHVDTVNDAEIYCVVLQ